MVKKNFFSTLLTAVLSMSAAASTTVSPDTSLDESHFEIHKYVKAVPPYKSKITISEEKLAAFKRWLNF